MENTNKEVENKEADTTANQPASTDETKTEEKKGDTPEVPSDETVTLSKKELEVLKKKAEDFERSVELKRLKKLEEKGEIKTETGDDVKDEIAKLREEISTFKANTYNSNLTEAYRTFVNDNPWANDDEKFDKIKEKFSAVGTETKEELLAKMKLAAQTAFPTEYEKHLEDKIKAEVYKDKANSNPGGNAAPATNLHKDTKEKTSEDKMKERMGELFNKNFKLRR